MRLVSRRDFRYDNKNTLSFVQRRKEKTLGLKPGARQFRIPQKEDYLSPSHGALLAVASFSLR